MFLNFTRLVGKSLCRSIFFNKVGDLKPQTSFKRNSDRYVFLWTLRNIWEHLFCKNLQNAAFERSIFWKQIAEELTVKLN